MDDIEDFTAVRLWDKKAWATCAYITAFASNRNILPLQGRLFGLLLLLCSQFQGVELIPLFIGHQLQNSFSPGYI